MESVNEVLDRANRALDLLGRDRGLLHPVPGFATFVDNPLASDSVAAAKLGAIAAAARRLREQGAP